MFDTLEQLHLKLLFLGLHDIDRSVSELVREREVVLCAREEQRLCTSGQCKSSAVTAEGPTCQVEEVRFLQECRMRKSTCCADTVARELVTHVWRSVAVPGAGSVARHGTCTGRWVSPDAGKFCVRFAIFGLHFVDPFRYSLVGERYVLLLP